MTATLETFVLVRSAALTWLVLALLAAIAPLAFGHRPDPC
jgi:hypothetical protein